MLKEINNYINSLPIDVEPSGLYAPIRYVLSLGGKRMRPMLMMMAYEMWQEHGTDVLPLHWRHTITSHCSTTT